MLIYDTIAIGLLYFYITIINIKYNKHIHLKTCSYSKVAWFDNTLCSTEHASKPAFIKCLRITDGDV